MSNTSIEASANSKYYLQQSECRLGKHSWDKSRNGFWEIAISWNNENQILDTFMFMRIKAECNETAPAISFNRFHKVV